MGSEFYKSPRWRALREKALKLHGRACQRCGDTTKLHVDHIKPRSKNHHLAFDLNNLQILCEDCNTRKSNLHETDYRYRLTLAKKRTEHKPEVPPELLARRQKKNAKIKKKTTERTRSERLAVKLAIMANLPSSQFKGKHKRRR